MTSFDDPRTDREGSDVPSRSAAVGLRRCIALLESIVFAPTNF